MSISSIYIHISSYRQVIIDVNVETNTIYIYIATRPTNLELEASSCHGAPGGDFCFFAQVQNAVSLPAVATAPMVHVLHKLQGTLVTSTVYRIYYRLL